MTKTDTAFKLLEEALKSTLLPTESGGCRRASADEFMLMLPEPKNGWWQFSTHIPAIIFSFMKLARLTFPVASLSCEATSTVRLK